MANNDTICRTCLRLWQGLCDGEKEQTVCKWYKQMTNDRLKQEVSDKRKEGRKMIRKLINRIRKRRFCKANRWFCPDCIYHEHLFDGIVYRGVRCHYPTGGWNADGN